ncbi:hypothetical protein ACH44C_02255 [Streptomyces purpureus]|uniref:hypothetical protein n=1 Tax=Streptomyces purpureus TaxID=1951 RepID=UPI0037982240
MIVRLAGPSAVGRRVTGGARLPLMVTVAVVPLYALWACWLATGAGDLAAQIAWAQFADRHPGGAYNFSWYGGMHAANYSLLTPHLMAAAGVRPVSVAAGLAGTWAMTRLVAGAPGLRAPLWPALLGAVTLWCNIASGRTTFAVGLTAALVACLLTRRPGPAALAATVTALTSPLAGLFLLAVGAAQLFLRRWRPAVALLAPLSVVQLGVALAFPFWGEQPMTAGALALPLTASVVFWAAAPRSWAPARGCAALYGAGVVLAFLIPSPVGSNADRLALVAAPTALLAVFLARPAPYRRGPLAVALVATALATSVWVLGRSADDLRHSTQVPAWASHTRAVTAQLRRLGAHRGRIEVVPARNHREAWLMARHFQLARGWNRQLDVERGRLFYDGTLSPSTYRAWLDHWAVGHIALHSGPPDGPAAAEAALIRSRPPWLKPVWQDEHWTIFAVDDAVPLARPGRAALATASEVVVDVDGPGPVTVRVRYSPWLRADRGARVEPAGSWVRLHAPGPGRYRLHAPYLTGLFGTVPPAAD